MLSGGDKPRDVRDVRHGVCAHVAGYLPDALEIDYARIGRRAAQYQLGLVLVRQPLKLVVIDLLGFRIDAVRNYFVAAAGKVERVAVRQVASVREVHAEDRVAVIERGQIDGHVGLRPRVRLDVDMLAAEDLPRALFGQVFGHVDILAAAVVTLAGIAFGILIRQYRPDRFEHRLGNEILRSDHLKVESQPPLFVRNRSGNLRVCLCKRSIHRVRHFEFL